MIERALEPLVSVLIMAGINEALAYKRAMDATNAHKLLESMRTAIVERTGLTEAHEAGLSELRARAGQLAQEAAAAAREAGSLRGDIAALRAIS
jgi:hypothetical protein